MMPEPNTPTDRGLSFGEAAALLYCMGKVEKEVRSMGKQKVPHMLYTVRNDIYSTGFSR